MNTVVASRHFELKRQQYNEELVALSLLGHFDVEASVKELESNGGDTEAAHKALQLRLDPDSVNHAPLITEPWPFRGNSHTSMLNPMQTDLEETSASTPSWAFDGLGLVQAKRGVNRLSIHLPKLEVSELPMPGVPSIGTAKASLNRSNRPGACLEGDCHSSLSIALASRRSSDRETDLHGLTAAVPMGSEPLVESFVPGMGLSVPDSHAGIVPRPGEKRKTAPTPEAILAAALQQDQMQPVWYTHSGVDLKFNEEHSARSFSKIGNAIPSVGLAPRRKRQKVDVTSSDSRKKSSRRGSSRSLSQSLAQCNSCHPDGLDGMAEVPLPALPNTSSSPSEVSSFTYHDLTDSGKQPPLMEDARQRKIAAQRRYREKKKMEIERLKGQEKELLKLQKRMEELQPFEVIAKVERARIDTGKRPRQWCYVETWPECKIVSETLCHEALGYNLLGRHCWDYKRFPGLKRNSTDTLKRHWNATVTKGGYPMYDFLDNQFFERLAYRDTEATWRWCQVTAYRLTDPSQHPTLLQCLETDVHDAVLFGRKHGLTEYIKNVGPNHAFHYLLKSNSAYTYQCYVSAFQTQHATSGNHTKAEARAVRRPNVTTVVSRTSAECRSTLGWEMAGMAADDPEEGHGIPVLHGKKNRLREIIKNGRTQGPMYYKRRIQKSDDLKSEKGANNTIIVEAWGHIVRPAGDGGVFIDILERNAVPDGLREVLGLT